MFDMGWNHFDTCSTWVERKGRVKGTLSEKRTAAPLISSRLASPRSTLKYMAAARHQGAPRQFKILGTSQTVHKLYMYRRAQATLKERAGS